MGKKNLHPSPQLYVAPPCGSKVRAKGTTWCIHVAEGAKLGQNGLKMGYFRLFWPLSECGIFIIFRPFSPFSGGGIFIIFLHFGRFCRARFLIFSAILAVSEGGNFIIFGHFGCFWTVEILLFSGFLAVS